MVDNIVKQIDNKEKKYGFQLYPENINRKGRPPKGQTLTDIMREILEENLPNEMSRKEALVRKVLDLAYSGNETMIKMAWNYLEGMPLQKQEIIGDTGIKVNIVDYGTDNKPTAEAEGSTKKG